MSRWFVAVVILVGAAPVVAAEPCPTGALPEGVVAHAVASPLLGETVCYLAIPPAGGMPEDPSRVGVLVLLHGWGGGPEEWLQRGRILEPLRALEKDGVLPLTLVIVPTGHDGYWTDWTDGKHPWRRSLLGEVLPDAVARYRPGTGPAYRAIAGISMGGFGAASIGLSTPDFGFVAALSPTDLDLAVRATPKKKMYRSVFGTPIDRKAVRRVNPYHLARARPAYLPTIALVYGEREADKFSKGTRRLHRALKRVGAKTTLHRVPGGRHGWKTTWTPAVHRDWLTALGAAWREQRSTAAP